MSKKVTKVDGSVDKKTVDRSTQLVTSSKVSCLGRLTKPWEACRRVPKVQLRTTTLPTAFRAFPRRLRMTLTKTPRTHSPPEWGSTWPSQTASAKSRTNEEKSIPDKTTTAKAESENVVAESVSAQQVSTEKAVDEKATEERVAIAAKTKRTQTRRRCSRMYQGTLDRQRLEEEQRYARFLGDVS